MARHVLRGLAALAVAWNAATVSAQDTATGFFSKDVDVVIRVQNPSQMLENLGSLADAAMPGTRDIVKQQAELALGRSISNMLLAGVDKSREWGVGIYANGAEPPTVVFAIPAADSEKMLSSLGDEITTDVRDGWVIYTEAAELPAGSEATALSLLQGPSKSLLDGGDVSVFVDVAQLTVAYRDQIDAMKDKILEGMNALRFMPQDSGIDVDATVDLVGGIADKLFQAVDDAQTWSLAVSFSEKELAINDRVEFAAGSVTSTNLAKHPKSALKAVGKLPDNQLGYVGIRMETDELIGWGISAALASSKETSDEKKASIVAAAKELEYGDMVSSFSFGKSGEGPMRLFQAVDVDSVEQARGVNRDMANEMKTISSPGVIQSAEIELDAETYGSFKADVVTMTTEFDDESDPSGMQRRIYSIMMNPEESVTRSIYHDTGYLMAMGLSQAETEAFLSDWTADKQNSASTVRNELPSEANLIVLVDLPSLTGSLMKSVSEIGAFPVPFDAETVDDLGLEVSYLGFGLAAEPNALTSRTRIPAKQLQGVAKLGVFFQSMSGGGGF